MNNVNNNLSIGGLFSLIAFLTLIATGFEFLILTSNEELSKPETLFKTDSLNKSKEDVKEEVSSKTNNKTKEIKKTSAKKTESKSTLTKWSYKAFPFFMKYGWIVRLIFVISYLLALGYTQGSKLENLPFPLIMFGLVVLFGGASSLFLFYKSYPKENLMVLKFPEYVFYISLSATLGGGWLVRGFFGSFFTTSIDTGKTRIPVRVEDAPMKEMARVVVGVDEKGNVIKEERNVAISVKTEHGYVNILNPFRGIGIWGGAGAGKSFSLINPIIKITIARGWAGAVYDYNYPALADEIHKAFHYYDPYKQHKTKFYILNFKDIKTSHRCNPLKPKLLKKVEYAEMYATTILENMAKNPTDENYFDLAKAALLKSIIWFLKTEHPQYCTIPHVISMATYSDSYHMISALTHNELCADFVSDAINAVKGGAAEQLAGVLGSLSTQAQKLISPQNYWLLTGDDFDLDINDPKNPKWVCVGSDSTIGKTLSPVIALIFNVAINLMNQPNKFPSAVILDEAPTINIPDIDNLPNTARKYHVCTVYAGQDISQMISRMGKDGKDKLIASLAFQFWGQTGNLDTAKVVVEMLGKEDVTKESSSTSTSRSDGKTNTSKSKSFSPHKEDIITSQQVQSLPKGTFVIKTTEGFYVDKIIVPDDNLHFPIKPFCFEEENEEELDKKMMQSYYKVKSDVDMIIKKYSNKFSKYQK